MTVAALDLGRRRIGLAVSDDSEAHVFPLGAIERRGGRTDSQEIARCLRDYHVGRLIVGLPLNMDGTEGAPARSARAFAERLGEELKLRVEMFDERLTSFEAEDRLKDSGIGRKAKRAAVDAIAAAVILEGWLAARARRPIID
jgi:putative holliday junction resolvase